MSKRVSKPPAADERGGGAKRDATEAFARGRDASALAPYESPYLSFLRARNIGNRPASRPYREPGTGFERSFERNAEDHEELMIIKDALFKPKGLNDSCKSIIPGVLMSAAIIALAIIQPPVGTVVASLAAMVAITKAVRHLSTKLIMKKRFAEIGRMLDDKNTPAIVRGDLICIICGDNVSLSPDYSVRVALGLIGRSDRISEEERDALSAHVIRHGSLMQIAALSKEDVDFDSLAKSMGKGEMIWQYPGLTVSAVDGLRGKGYWRTAASAAYLSARALGKGAQAVLGAFAGPALAVLAIFFADVIIKEAGGEIIDGVRDWIGECRRECGRRIGRMRDRLLPMRPEHPGLPETKALPQASARTRTRIGSGEAAGAEEEGEESPDREGEPGESSGSASP